MSDLELGDRLTEFAVDCVAVTCALPSDRVGSASIAADLIRASAGVGDKHVEALRAESPRDEFRLLKASLMDLNEARMWLRIIDDSHYVPNDLVAGAIAESEALTGILSSEVAALRRRLHGNRVLALDEYAVAEG